MNDAKTELQKSRLRKIKRNPFALLLGIGGLYLSSVNVFTAIKIGTVEYAGRTSKYSGPISYHDHPINFDIILALSIFGIPFCSWLLYVYFFKKIDAD
jgi:hypothetical protein